MTLSRSHFAIHVAAAGVLLVLAYLALGGGSAGPQAVADPCRGRPWRDISGVRQVAERIVLSSLDGVACERGVSREALTLDIASDGDLDAFLRARGISEDELDDLLRTGLRRAVADARAAGALGVVEAILLGQAVERLPLGRLIETYRSGDLDWIALFL